MREQKLPCKREGGEREETTLPPNRNLINVCTPAICGCRSTLLKASTNCHTHTNAEQRQNFACVCEHPVRCVRVYVLWFGYLQQALPLVLCKIKLFRLVKRALISLRVCVCICVCVGCVCVYSGCQQLSRWLRLIKEMLCGMWHSTAQNTHNFGTEFIELFALSTLLDAFYNNFG